MNTLVPFHWLAAMAFAERVHSSSNRYPWRPGFKDRMIFIFIISFSKNKCPFFLQIINSGIRKSNLLDWLPIFFKSSTLCISAQCGSSISQYLSKILVYIALIWENMCFSACAGRNTMVRSTLPREPWGRKFCQLRFMIFTFLPPILHVPLLPSCYMLRAGWGEHINILKKLLRITLWYSGIVLSGCCLF